MDQALDLTCMIGEVGSTTRIEVVDEDTVAIDQGRMIPDSQAIHQLIQELEGGS